MIIQAIGKLLGVFLMLACMGAMLFYVDYQNEKVDSAFEIRMLKDKSRIRRDLKETEFEEKTIQAITYELENVQQNMQRYVQRRSDTQSFLLILIISMAATFGTTYIYLRHTKLYRNPPKLRTTR